jgi:hypothetical protein
MGTCMAHHAQANTLAQPKSLLHCTPLPRLMRVVMLMVARNLPCTLRTISAGRLAYLHGDEWTSGWCVFGIHRQLPPANQPRDPVSRARLNEAPAKITTRPLFSSLTHLQTRRVVRNGTPDFTSSRLSATTNAQSTGIGELSLPPFASTHVQDTSRAILILNPRFTALSLLLGHLHTVPNTSSHLLSLVQVLLAFDVASGRLPRHVSAW